jgi:hypothetical protein
MPFTGLVVGGLAVIIITLIAYFSEQQYRQIFKSVLIVLMIKAIISPYTPFSAYVAVSFQAIMGFIIFYAIRINFISILLFSTIAMIESAVQKLLVLTIFFGRSFWKATDELINFIASQFNLQTINGNQWLIGIYLLIYFVGGIIIAWMAYTIMRTYRYGNTFPVLNGPDLLQVNSLAAKKKSHSKPWIILAILITLSVLLFVFAPDAKQGWVAVIKTLSWVSAIMLAWYMIISPLLTKLIRMLLNKKMNSYGGEISDILSSFPVLKRVAVIAWRKSGVFKGPKRWSFFLSAVIHWSLIYPGEPA